MKKPLKWLRKEQGAATIIEYAIVLPVCLFIILFVFTIGFFLNQQALLDSAAERGILLVQKMYTDPNATDVLDMKSGPGFYEAGYQKRAGNQNKYNYDPYRFWGRNYKNEEITNLVKSRVENIVKESQSEYIALFLTEPKAEYHNNGGLISKNVEVTVSQELKVFSGLSQFWGHDKLTLEGNASMHVISQTEFVRNVDFISDVLERFPVVDNTIKRIKSALDKITKLFTGS